MRFWLTSECGLCAVGLIVALRFIHPWWRDWRYGMAMSARGLSTHTKDGTGNGLSLNEVTPLDRVMVITCN